jgi:hypothetical protein
MRDGFRSEHLILRDEGAVAARRSPPGEKPDPTAALSRVRAEKRADLQSVRGKEQV